MHIFKIFSFFNVNSITTPTSLSFGHHIYITDGLFYANDMIKCLEKISRTSITFSFIYSGNSLNQKQDQLANNISSSFGFVADHYLMKFIAQMTNGFYSVIDENLDHYFILKKNLLFFTDLIKLNKCEEMINDLEHDTIIENENIKPFLPASTLPQSKSFCCNNNTNENFLYQPDTFRSNHFSSAATHRFSSQKTNSKQMIKDDQKFEIKFIQKYELQSSVNSIYKLIRYRSQEGFNLVKISKSLINNNSTSMITLHFKRYFTQTTIIYYKLSYFHNLLTNNNSFKKQESPFLATSPASNSAALASNKRFKSAENELDEKLVVEIWLSWNFLHIKAKYQNLILTQQLKHTLNHIQKLDFDRSFTLTSLMLKPPDILRLKEPLFKLTSLPVPNNLSNPNETANDLKALKFSFQNSNFEINIRNKSSENDFIDFANSWFSLAFFKYNSSTLNKNFGVHTFKIILDHDKQQQLDNTTSIFTIKNSLSALEHQQAQQFLISNQLSEKLYDNNEYLYYNNGLNYNNPNNNNNNYQNNFAKNYYDSNVMRADLTNQTVNSENNSSLFQCRNSFNRLCIMLIEWCDLVLVENCVFLKYLKTDLINNELKACKKDSNEKIDEIITNESTKYNSSNNTNKKLSMSENESFVIIKMDTSMMPYVSLQYLFHSSLNYHERMKELQVFKEKLKLLNLKHLNNETNSSAGLRTNSTTNTTPPPPVIITPPSKLAVAQSIILNSPSNLKSNNNSNNNNNNTNKSNLVVAQSPTNSTTISKKNKKQKENCCILLQKPDLFDSILSHFSKISSSYSNDKKLITSSGQQWHNPSQVLNFMTQKKYKWSIDKMFSTSVSLILKENIIDTFIRTRLREGFKCLFQCSKFAVFTIQLNMYDQGNDISNNKNEHLKRKQTTIDDQDSNNSTQPKSGSSQVCTFVYVVYFMNDIQQISTHYYKNQIIMKSNQYQRNNEFLSNSQNIDQNLDSHQNDDLIKYNENKSVYFLTEIYSEVISGIYQDKKQASLINESKANICDYFRNLNHKEIINLMFLIDLKSFSTIQSVSALFLVKSNSILNLYSLLNTNNEEVYSNNNNNMIETSFIKVAQLNSNFYDSIRILPDLNLISKSLQSTGNTVQQQNQYQSRLNSVGEIPSATTNFLKRIKLQQNISSLTSPTVFTDSSSKQSNNEINEDGTSLRKKKSDSILLHEQLKPVLNNPIFLPAKVVPRDLIDINFQFSLRGILFESSLYMNVFEDIPLNLFSSNNSCSSQKNNINPYEISSIIKIQKLFFANIDENFKKSDPNSSNNFASAPIPPPPTTARSQATNRKSSSSVDDFDIKNQSVIIENVKNEIKNTICLRLNEMIKSGDTIVKQIIENLNTNSTFVSSTPNAMAQSSADENFQFFFKLNIGHTTSNETDSLNHGWTRNIMNLTEQLASMDQLDNENRFFIFGLFFLNNSLSNDLTVNNSQMSVSSNRLVFFMFDCMSDNIKKSIINSNSNTFLIRKSLFSNQKISNKVNLSNEPNKIAFSDKYKFYCSKNSTDQLKTTNNTSTTTNNNNNVGKYKFSSNNGEVKSSFISSNNASSNLTPTNFMKKVFSISDILKFHLIQFNNNSNTNDLFFLNYIDFIEENCAKSYIESVIHYLGLHSSINSSLYRSISTAEDKRVKFETDSIKQLLRIGRKIKLTDLDLTEYLRIICAHLNSPDSFDCTKKCNSNCNDSCRHSYLEKKFNDLFLKKFNLLPGFNDLFIFTPNQYYKNLVATSNEQISSIDHSFDNNDLAGGGGGVVVGSRRPRKLRKSMSKNKRKSPHTYSHSEIKTTTHSHLLSQSLLGTLKSTARSSDSIKNLIEKELNESMNKSLGDLLRNQYNEINDDYDDDDSDDEINYDFKSSDEDDQDQDKNKLRTAGGENSCISDNDSNNENSFNFNLKKNKKLLHHVQSSTTTEEDATTTDLDDEILHMRKNSFKARRKNKFKSSSPFSNSSVILNKNFDPLKNNNNNTSSKENPLVINTQPASPAVSDNKMVTIGEQIISIELVCIIDNDLDDTSNTLMPVGSNTDLDDVLNMNRPTNRVRTNTLTPDYSTNPDGLDNSENRTTSETMPQQENDTVKQQQQQQQTASFKTNISSKRTTFYSKFNKLNLQCLLDLIEEKDKNEFKLLVKHLESELSLNSEKAETNPLFNNNNVKVYLRFHWYSFSDLNLNYTSTALMANAKNASAAVQQINSNKFTQQQQNLVGNVGTFSSKLLLQQQQQQRLTTLPLGSNYQSPMIDTNALLLQKSTYQNNDQGSSIHSSSSTVYNSMTNVACSNNNAANNNNSNKYFNKNINQHQQQFEYNHILNPILKTFKWHLKDEIFQLEQTKIKSLLMFISHMDHIKEGVQRKYSHCRLIKRKIILNRKKTTIISTLVDSKQKTNVSKLLSANHLRVSKNLKLCVIKNNLIFFKEQQSMNTSPNNKLTYKTVRHEEDDKTILSVDSEKFFVELITLIKNLDEKFFNCKLQQMNDFFYYLNCDLNSQNKTSNMKLNDTFASYPFKILIQMHNNIIKQNLNPAQPLPAQKSDNNNRLILNSQSQESHQEITTNQIKIKIYFSFNHTSFQNRDDLIDSLIVQFNQLLNKLIKTVYLSLTLKYNNNYRKLFIFLLNFLII